MKIYSDTTLLNELDQEFIEFLAHNNPVICDDLLQFRMNTQLTKDEYSEFIINISPYLDDFAASKFNIIDENNRLRSKSNSQNIIFEARRKFVERYAIRHYNPDNMKIDHLEDVSNQLKQFISNLTQENIAANCLKWLADKKKYYDEIDVAAKYCSIMLKINSSLALFDIPRKIDKDNHIRAYRINQLEQRTQIGFDFRDSESTMDTAQTHANYCLYCHKQHKDTCSTGFNHSNENEAHDTKQKDGCPLDQKISEMNLLKSQGYNIAALAIIAIDNPLVALTGHRICNDCAKACIFQKQTPVNIPLVETQILESVLALPFGVEIYYLLTQWNPLKLKSYLPEERKPYSVLVTGLGPAGIAASYYFCRQGYKVSAIDGLKILDCPININEPIKNWSNLNIALSTRVPQGFGGVAEYGITNRWNKNFLLLARIILQRSSNFNYHGSIRLGSNLNVDQVFEYGFDHISLCLGAGKPKYLPDSGYFLKGVKSSADFLMQLQQAAAYNVNSTTNLQIRLPAYVYGCGLTAIDSAVELLNYYPAMVSNFVKKYNPTVVKNLSSEELEIAEEYVKHAEIFAKCQTTQDVIDSIKLLGGVNIIYRKKIQDSPAYDRNHEEIEHAIATGINFIEETSITEAIGDKYGSISNIKLSNGTTKAVRTLLLGLGTGKCDFTDLANAFDLNNRFFKSSDNRISYFGDCNPEYHGSVVKAISSVKDGYEIVTQTIESKKPQGLRYKQFENDLNSYVVANNKLTELYSELTISSPLAAKNYKVGQFFRLQNISADIANIMKPIAISPYKINRKKGEISFLIRNVGKSSYIASKLSIREKVALMGPTGDSLDISNLLNKQTEIMILCKNIGAAIAMPLVESLLEAKHKVYLVTDLTNDLANILSLNDHYQAVDNLKIYDVDTTNSVDSVFKSMHADGVLKSIKKIFSFGNSDYKQNVPEYISKYFNNDVESISMINAPMQCLMKGICGQCIQKVDDNRGYIFACNNNIENTSCINFDSLSQRQRMNSLLEKIK